MNKTKKHSNAIKTWPNEDRPREKLLRNGEHTLSDSELLAIILRTGIKGQSAVDLARMILCKFKTFRNMGHTDIYHWREFRGLGNAKIAQIKAAIEIGRRFRDGRIKEMRPKIKSSKDVVKILMPRMRDLKKEVFKMLMLNSQNRIIDIVEIENGTVNQAFPLIREIFQKALQDFAACIICVHNHPSGSPQPSQQDKKFTQELVQAGKIFMIDTLDHIIIGDNRFFSFADSRLL
jgi:DNA repair protein RadC